MSIYEGEKSANFEACLDSLRNQTLAADEIVIVSDGPIGAELHRILKNASDLPIKFIPLKTNQGLGLALNHGLTYCQHDLVARMDTDDICLPQRFEMQIAFMSENPDVAVSSGHIEEFGHGDSSQTPRIRRVPLTREQMVQWIKRRSPMNHPAVALRKSAVLAVGGYPVQRYAQDYQLWINLYSDGYELANIDKVLLKFRVSPDFYKKRGGLKYVGFEFRLQSNLYRKGVIGLSGFAFNLLSRSAVRVLPNFARGLVYSFLRRGS